MREVRPYPAYRHTYRHIYPFSDSALANLAYSFTYTYAQPQPMADYPEPLAKAIDDWKRSASRAHLVQVEEGEQLLLFDHRNLLRPEQITALDGMHRQALLACAEIRHSAELQYLLERQLSRSLTTGEVAETVRPLLAEGWLVREGDCLLSATVPSLRSRAGTLRGAPSF
ncbi:MAG: hypothetical protein NTV14_09355 [Coprothermobacterota bacterium]|nr:hypothetical protein [Coprothermobacterota bacterium]